MLSCNFFYHNATSNAQVRVATSLLINQEAEIPHSFLLNFKDKSLLNVFFEKLKKGASKNSFLLILQNESGFKKFTYFKNVNIS